MLVATLPTRNPVLVATVPPSPNFVKTCLRTGSCSSGETCLVGSAPTRPVYIPWITLRSWTFRSPVLARNLHHAKHCAGCLLGFFPYGGGPGRVDTRLQEHLLVSV